LPGCVGHWNWIWSNSGESAGKASFIFETNFLMLRYTSNGADRVQEIPIVRTPCNFGGSRPWLLCPIRGERVAVLYFRAGRFACRHCQRIAFASQSEDAVGRAWRRQRKVEDRLGPEGERPKGMHASTYDRLLSVIEECEELKDGHLFARLHRMGFEI